MIQSTLFVTQNTVFVNQRPIDQFVFFMDIFWLDVLMVSFIVCFLRIFFAGLFFLDFLMRRHCPVLGQPEQESSVPTRDQLTYLSSDDNHDGILRNMYNSKV